MKRTPILYICIALASIMLLGGCKERSKQENVMYVSIAPIKYIVEQIVGDDFRIEVLVPAGASPETFEPTPRQFIELNTSRLIFSTGLLDFERALLNKVENRTKIIDLSRGIHPIAGTCSHTHHGHHCHHGIDPHIWCSPKELQTMAENTFSAIRTEMPDSIKYEERYNILCQKLLDLDEEVAEMCRYARLPYFVIYHPALTYFARAYGIEQVAIESEGKEAGVKRIGNIIDKARKDGVTKVLYQSEFPKSSVEAICEEIGAEAVEINPLQENIIENLREITRLITE